MNRKIIYTHFNFIFSAFTESAYIIYYSLCEINIEDALINERG